jgi:hypothetical protein
MFKANIIIILFIMKKQFLNLGKALNKAEQKQIFGGVDMNVNNPGDQGGGSGRVWCKCTSNTGSARGPETSCEACFNYCKHLFGADLVSSLCTG